MIKKIIIKLIFSFFILMLLISINHKIERGIKYDVVNRK
jgi:hypothetical protein